MSERQHRESVSGAFVFNFFDDKDLREREREREQLLLASIISTKRDFERRVQVLSGLAKNKIKTQISFLI